MFLPVPVVLLEVNLLRMEWQTLGKSGITLGMKPLPLWLEFEFPAFCPCCCC